MRKHTSDPAQKNFLLTLSVLVFTLSCLAMAFQSFSGLFLAIIVSGCLMALIVSNTDRGNSLGAAGHGRQQLFRRPFHSNRGGL